jgi:hypothetical protein
MGDHAQRVARLRAQQHTGVEQHTAAELRSTGAEGAMPAAAGGHAGSAGDAGELSGMLQLCMCMPGW